MFFSYRKYILLKVKSQNLKVKMEINCAMEGCPNCKNIYNENTRPAFNLNPDRIHAFEVEFKLEDTVNIKTGRRGSSPACAPFA